MKKILFAIALVLVACGDPPPTQGTVIDKKYEPAHWESGYRTEYQPQYKCRTVSNYDYASKQYKLEEQCGTEMEPVQVYESHHEYVGDRWRLKLEQCGTGKSKKCRSGWITVSESRYEKYPIDSYYSGELK